MDRRKLKQATDGAFMLPRRRAGIGAVFNRPATHAQGVHTYLLDCMGTRPGVFVSFGKGHVACGEAPGAIAARTLRRAAPNPDASGTTTR